MFTGLIADLGGSAQSSAMRMARPWTYSTGLSGEIAEGDSVAVNGVCLTATAVSEGGFRAQAMIETLRRSSARVVAARLAGEPRARAASRRKARRAHRARARRRDRNEDRGNSRGGFRADTRRRGREDLARYLVEKGSVTLDGVSLTVSGVSEEGFSVSLIPETLARTSLAGTQVGIGQSRGGTRQHVERTRRGRRPNEPVEDPHPVATVEEAIEEIEQGKMVVVCDDEDRENEGDLTMAAEFATPRRSTSWPGGARARIALADLRALRRTRLNLMAAKNESFLRNAGPRLRRGARGGDHGHLRTPPRRHDPGGDRPGDRPARPCQPGHVLPLKSRAGGVGANRADRGGCGPCAARGLEPGRGDLRGDERYDGTMARVPDLVDYCAPRAEDDHGGRPDRLPSPPATAVKGGLHGPSDRVRGLRGGGAIRRRGQQAPCRAGQGRRQPGRRARARALGVPHRRRSSSRCRGCDCARAATSALAMISARDRVPALPLPGGAGDWAAQQAARIPLQEEGLDTVEANERGLSAHLRDYGIGAQILVDLGLSSTASSRTIRRRSRASRVTGCRSRRDPIEHAPNEHNEANRARRPSGWAASSTTRGSNLDEELLQAERNLDREATGEVRDRIGRFYEDSPSAWSGARARLSQKGTPHRESSTCRAPSSRRSPRAGPRGLETLSCRRRVPGRG